MLSKSLALVSMNRNEGIKDTGKKHPCQFVHITIKGRNGEVDIPHINIAVVYLPYRANNRHQALLGLLKELGNLPNAIAVGDFNIDQFDHPFIDDHSIEILKLGYGQLMTVSLDLKILQIAIQD